MTKIYLYGKIAKIFGNFFTFKVKNAISAIKAIDANRNNFLKTLIELNRENCSYCLIIDGKQVSNIEEYKEIKNIKKILIIPLIAGSGEFISAFLAAVPSIITNLAVSFALSYISSLLTKKNESIQAEKIAVGGGSKMIEAQGKSYVFSNSLNVASQGASIPVGYGRFKATSNVIYFSTLNYPTNRKYNEEFIGNESLTVLSDFIAN